MSKMQRNTYSAYDVDEMIKHLYLDHVAVHSKYLRDITWQLTPKEFNNIYTVHSQLTGLYKIHCHLGKYIQMEGSQRFIFEFYSIYWEVFEKTKNPVIKEWVTYYMALIAESYKTDIDLLSVEQLFKAFCKIADNMNTEESARKIYIILIRRNIHYKLKCLPFMLGPILFLGSTDPGSPIEGTIARLHFFNHIVTEATLHQRVELHPLAIALSLNIAVLVKSGQPLDDLIKMSIAEDMIFLIHYSLIFQVVTLKYWTDFAAKMVNSPKTQALVRAAILFGTLYDPERTLSDLQFCAGSVMTHWATLQVPEHIHIKMNNAVLVVANMINGQPKIQMDVELPLLNCGCNYNVTHLKPPSAPSGVPPATASGVPPATASGVPRATPSRVPRAAPSRVPRAAPSRLPKAKVEVITIDISDEEDAKPKVSSKISDLRSSNAPSTSTSHVTKKECDEQDVKPNVTSTISGGSYVQACTAPSTSMSHVKSECDEQDVKPNVSNTISEGSYAWASVAPSTSSSHVSECEEQGVKPNVTSTISGGSYVQACTAPSTSMSHVKSECDEQDVKPNVSNIITEGSYVWASVAPSTSSSHVSECEEQGVQPNVASTISEGIAPSLWHVIQSEWDHNVSSTVSEGSTMAGDETESAPALPDPVEPEMPEQQ